MLKAGRFVLDPCQLGQGDLFQLDHSILGRTVHDQEWSGSCWQPGPDTQQSPIPWSWMFFVMGTVPPQFLTTLPPSDPCEHPWGELDLPETATQGPADVHRASSPAPSSPIPHEVDEITFPPGFWSSNSDYPPCSTTGELESPSKTPQGRGDTDPDFRFGSFKMKWDPSLCGPPPQAAFQRGSLTAQGEPAWSKCQEAAAWWIFGCFFSNFSRGGFWWGHHLHHLILISDTSNLLGESSEPNTWVLT